MSYLLMNHNVLLKTLFFLVYDIAVYKFINNDIR